jgi:excisionase family DNA binding protein
MSNLKTLKQVAPILNVKPVTLYRLCKNREIPYRKVGCKIMFSDEDIQQYLSSTFVKPTTTGGENERAANL